MQDDWTKAATSVYGRGSLRDEFDRKRDQLKKTTFADLKDKPELVAELLEDKTSYGETFFRARAAGGSLPPSGT
jgi:hypothetical protein